MSPRLIAITALVAAVAAAAGQSAQARPKTAICGQIKHGPHAAYTSLLTHRKLSGATWTVFATGVPCSKALTAAPAILRWWGRAKVEAHSTIAGFGCNKESDGRGSSGSAGCIYRGLSNIELIMTGSATIAQLKQQFFIS